MPAKLPPVWKDEQLDVDRIVAKQLFREERLREPLEEYLDQLEDARDGFDDLLATSVDLTQLREKALEVVSTKRLFTALRYLPGPPISTDDLKVLADASLAQKHLRSSRDLALKIVDTILIGFDRRRFPWVAEQRDATEDERACAVLASSVLLATRRVETMRRNVMKRNQEERVKVALRDVRFKEVKRRKIDHLSKAPQPGEFCGESTIGTKKADIIVGLWDHRTMAIECKVSNSAVNSIKRLNDTDAKVKHWAKHFGLQVVPSAVLSGVYDRISLQHAQEGELFLFWAHDLEKLTTWIETTRK